MTKGHAWDGVSRYMAWSALFEESTLNSRRTALESTNHVIIRAPKSSGGTPVLRRTEMRILLDDCIPRKREEKSSDRQSVPRLGGASL